MHASLRAIAVGVAILTTGTTAANTVSLSSFTPRINNINDSLCQSVYTAIIAGCTPNDFVLNARCSSECIKGLFAVGELVKTECKDVDVGETSIIGVFQNDIGIRALCPGNSLGAVPIQFSSTKAAQTSTQAATSRATSAAPPASSLKTSTSTSTSTSSANSQSVAASSSSSSLSSSSTSSQGLNTDPNPTSIAGGSTTNVAQPPAPSSKAARPTPPPTAQLSNADSGGGSPFDVQATGGSSRARVLDLTTLVLAGTAVLFVACT